MVSRISGSVIGALGGGVYFAALGCVIGFFAAHHFAIYGGLLLLGQPYSEARYKLVPGHMLLFGIILGIGGGILGSVAGAFSGWLAERHFKANQLASE